MVEHDEQLRAQLADLYRPAFLFPVLLGSEIYRLAQPWVGQRTAQLADRLSSYDDNLVASTGVDIASVAGDNTADPTWWDTPIGHVCAAIVDRVTGRDGASGSRSLPGHAEERRWWQSLIARA